jgi:uncharacterized membrane protein
MLNPLGKEPLSRTALGLDFPSASVGGKIWRIFQYLVELCLIVGFFKLIFRPRAPGVEFKAEYISLTIVSALILLGIYVLPTTGWGLGSVRIFHIVLLLMAPLFLFGGEAIGYGIMKLGRLFRRGFASFRLSLDSPVPLRCLVLAVLIPYFVFNSGVVFELSRSQTTYFIDIPYSIALSSYRVDVSTVFTAQDVAARDWVSKVAEEDHPVYVDHHSGKLLGTQTGCVIKVYQFPLDIRGQKLYSPSYIYLRTWNTQKELLTFGTAYAARQGISLDHIPGLITAFESSDRIYTNGGAQILVSR